jgi:hypothetical protein
MAVSAELENALREWFQAREEEGQARMQAEQANRNFNGARLALEVIEDEVKKAAKLGEKTQERYVQISGNRIVRLVRIDNQRVGIYPIVPEE